MWGLFCHTRLEMLMQCVQVHWKHLADDPWVWIPTLTPPPSPRKWAWESVGVMVLLLEEGNQIFLSGGIWLAPEEGPVLRIPTCTVEEVRPHLLIAIPTGTHSRSLTENWSRHFNRQSWVKVRNLSCFRGEREAGKLGDVLNTWCI